MDPSIARSLKQEINPLMSMFFDKSNIDNIQNALMQFVLRETGTAIERQSDQDLVAIMRGIYLQHRHSPDIQHDLKVLNHEILRITSKQVLSGLRAWKQSMERFDRVPQPMENPVYINSIGENSLRLPVGLE